MDITNTAQPVIFLRGITAEFEKREELLSLQAIHGTTEVEDLFEKLVLSMERFGLKFEQLSGFTTDGSPAMVGSQEGTEPSQYRPKRFGCMPLHHTSTESLCKSLWFSNVMSISHVMCKRYQEQSV
ncbi:hypothetical protein M514_00250 [Trichuris suis]|uniref:DUF4371 domain-containing protein n=1 Tax=Trichuris suis TaxID=68888 RepID=A0A085MPE1_9BILA|nr:hypothetical protein M513_00250 [Trichuris suis]KFD67848.1 hypothetical protein M514_00250 [Trichuris suis]KHJ46085.1 hypothetical protein D918_03748 [Trichuris suis]